MNCRRQDSLYARCGIKMKKTSELPLTFRDIIPYIHIGQCYKNAFLVADVYPEVEYLEGWVFNHQEWIQHAWNRLNGEQFDLTYQIHFPHLVYCDRRIEIAGTLEFLSALGYSFTLGFAPLIEQRYRVVAQNQRLNFPNSENFTRRRSHSKIHDLYSR